MCARRRLLPHSSERGISLVQLLVALAIAGGLALVVSTVYDYQSRIRGSADLRREAMALKSEILSGLSCKVTDLAPKTSAACNNDAATFASCDANALPDGNDRWTDLLRDNGKVLLTGRPTLRGRVETRVCCPGGDLRVEWRVGGAGKTKKVDPLQGNLTDTWQPVFRVMQPCGSGSDLGSNFLRVEGTLRITSYQCPGYFPVSGTWPPSAIMEGTATCPPGRRLVSGGVECNGLGPTNLIVSSRPFRPSASDPKRWAETTNTWFGSCCGVLPAAPKRVHAICE